MAHAELAARIDSTLLRPEATPDEVAAVCEQAVSLGCAAAVVLPLHLALCVEIAGTLPTAPCTVAAFPTGGLTRDLLAAETSDAMDRGARASANRTVSPHAEMDPRYRGPHCLWLTHPFVCRQARLMR